MASCILFQTDDDSVVLLDIPRSIELAQGDSTRKIISSVPLKQPFPSVEPKTAKARAKLGEVSLEDLILQKHLQISLDGLKEAYQGDWCFPRLTAEPEPSRKKRKRRDDQTDEKGQDDHKAGIHSCVAEVESEPQCRPSTDPFLIQNEQTESIYHLDGHQTRARVPPGSTALQGEIDATAEMFSLHAPKFKLITMDPPWPNRSARRKSSYATSHSSIDIQTLLSSIPINNHLAEGGLVAVWVTNKPTFRQMLLHDGGLFDEWGIELMEEWFWVKVTVAGETICALDSLWRKPYELLLVGRKKGIETGRSQVKRKVIVSVPDLHSRKPNLKALFQPLIACEKFEALEIFARNLTAGWWAWGDEVLRFQRGEHWVEEADS